LYTLKPNEPEFIDVHPDGVEIELPSVLLSMKTISKSPALTVAGIVTLCVVELLIACPLVEATMGNVFCAAAAAPGKNPGMNDIR
jgi:hypothetical protein